MIEEKGREPKWRKEKRRARIQSGSEDFGGLAKLKENKVRG